MKEMRIRRSVRIGVCMLALTVLCLCGFSGRAHAKGISASKVKKLADKTIKKQTKKIAKTDREARLERILAYADEKFAYAPTDAAILQEALLKNRLSDKSFRKAAYNMLKKRRGTCIHEAAALAYLIRRSAGYPTRFVLGQTDAFKGEDQLHAWVEANVNGTWMIFDSNLDRTKGKTHTWFRIPADGSDERSAHYRPVWKKEV